MPFDHVKTSWILHFPIVAVCSSFHLSSSIENGFCKVVDDSSSGWGGFSFPGSPALTEDALYDVRGAGQLHLAPGQDRHRRTVWPGRKAVPDSGIVC